jgi:hypothetical protein
MMLPEQQRHAVSGISPLTIPGGVPTKRTDVSNAPANGAGARAGRAGACACGGRAGDNAGFTSPVWTAISSGLPIRAWRAWFRW